GDRGRYEKELEAESYYEEGLKYYARGQMDLAVEQWEKCLKINPGFTPARNSIKLVSNSKKLFDRVIDIQSLE
ncbi:MAG: tetratricopeptide repeat protein, partial [Treponema sp.]|nr:tetratricopeptide repeat protein [Treponema sp.]